MTRWDAGYAYRAKKPAHRWRVAMPGLHQCRICDAMRMHAKWTLDESGRKGRLWMFQPPGQPWTAEQHVPPCSGVP